MCELITEDPALLKKIEETKRKENAQALSAICNIFGELNINRIIYVDDRCSIQELKESFIGKLKGYYELKPAEILFVNWASPQPVFEREINTVWDDAEEEAKKEMFVTLLKFEKNPQELENSIAPLQLKGLLKNKIQLLSPSNWVAKKNEILSELKEDFKILFLFDIEFNNAPLTDGRDGKDLAAEILSNHSIEKFVYCGLFSHLFNIEEEGIKRNEYCKSHGLEKERFYTISKKRFRDDSYLPGLAEGIKNTLLINEVESLKDETINIIKKAFVSSIKELKELNPDSFNHIIQKSSHPEGVWEMTTLLRINQIVTNNKALLTLLPDKRRTKINQNLLKIRKIEKIKTGSLTPFDKTQIQLLRKTELFLDNKILNQLHFPISNGDIFLINSKEYILLGQPCNLALRSKGERDRNYDIGFLVEIESIDEKKLNSYAKGQLSTFELIENSNSNADEYKIVRFSTFKTVSLSALDLTVFNSDGSAIIDLNKTKYESMIIQDSWKLRYKSLHNEFSEYKNRISTFRKLKSLNKDSLKEVVYYGDIFKGFNINNEDVLNITMTKLKFKIKRISHYKQPYSTDLLQKFMSYLSRNGFDHDFSKDSKIS